MRALPLAIVALVALAAAPPGAVAGDRPEREVRYAATAGSMPAGLPAALAPANVDRERFAVEACHRQLVVELAYEPTGAGASTPAADASVPYVFRLDLADADDGTHLARMTWHDEGTRSVALDRPRAVEAELTYRQGGPTEYRLTVHGQVHPDAACRWGGQLFVNEVEANPTGHDARVDEWVELHHGGLAPVDLDGWTLRAHHGEPASVPLDGVRLAPGDHRVVASEDPLLDNRDEIVTLEGPLGWEVDRTPRHDDRANDGNTWQRTPDAGATWRFLDATRGTANPSR